MTLMADPRLTGWLTAHGFIRMGSYWNSYRKVISPSRHVWVHLMTTDRGYVERKVIDDSVWFSGLTEMGEAVIYRTLGKD